MNPRPSGRFRAAPRRLLGVSLALAMLFGASAANADVVYDRNGNLVMRPTKHYLTPTVRPAVIVAPPSVVVTPAPAPSVVLVAAKRNPYDTSGLVIAGAGVGGLLLRGSDVTSLVPTYRLHLGLAVGQAQIGLRSNLAPRALTLFEGTPEATDISLYATRLTFDYRFLRDAVVHPVAGAGLEAIVADPSRGETGLTLAGTARIGLEFAYPIGASALAVGIDATGHLPFAQTDAMAVDLSAMLSFGAYLDFRF
jgi:hypothetical protein